MNLHLQSRVGVGLWQGKQHFHDILKSVRAKIFKNTVNTFTLQPSKETAQLFSVSQLRDFEGHRG